jgi:DNA (cytosine-5)-methyltransferase 1
VRFGSLCSGIEAASEAWLPLGWTCAYVAEVEPFPCAYLAARHGATRPRYMPRPEDACDEKEAKRRRAAIKALDRITWGDRLLNLGDISQVSADELPPADLAAAGFPCQDFSIAGLRASLAGARGSLSTIGVRLLLEVSERGLVRGAVLEQVPDVLNTEDNAWGNILGALVGADAALEGLEHGGKWPRAGMVAGPRARAAWRVLDAQHFRLAQRRERVWAVVDFGGGPDPAAVLFERKGVPGHLAARGSAGEGVAPTLAGGARKRGGHSLDDVPAIPIGPQRRSAFGGNNTSGPIDVATARTASHSASGRQDFESETFVVDGQYGAYRASDIAATLRAEGADCGHGPDASEDGTGRGTPIVPVELVAGTLPAAGKAAGSATQQDASSGLLVPVAYSIMPQNSGKDYKAREVDVAQPVMAGGPVGGNQGGDYIVQPPIAFSAKDHGADAGQPSPTLRAMNHNGSRANAGGQVAIAFNARQDPISGPVVGPVVGPVDTDGGTHAIAFSLRGREGGAMPEVEGEDVVPALRAAEGGSTRPFVAFDETQITSQANRSNPQPGDPCHPLTSQGRPPTLASTMAVRRITVVEAERLQGFPDNATLIDWPSANRKGHDLAETVAYLIGHGFSPVEAEALAQTPDGPRYRAIGNSWPVAVAAWIGERIDALEAEKRAA